MAKRYIALILIMFMAVLGIAQPINAEASSRTEYIEPDRVSIFNVGPLSVDVNGYATGQQPYGTSLYWAEYPNSLGWQQYAVPIKNTTVATETRIIYTFSEEDLLKLKTADQIKIEVNCDDPNAYGSSWADPNNGLSTPANTGIHVGVSLVTWDNYIWDYKELYMGTNAFASPRAYLNTIMPREFNGDFSKVKGIAVWTMMQIPPTNGNSYIQISGTADVTLSVELTYDTDKLTNNQMTNIGNEVGKISTNLENGIGVITGNQSTIIQKIQVGFDSVRESVKTGVVNAVNELFVPDEQAVQDFFINMNDMEEEHLKPIAQLKDTVSSIEQTLFNPNYDAQIAGDLAPVAGYINTVQGNGVFIFPGYEMKLPEGNFTLWEDYVIDVGATLDDMGLSWIPTVTKAICIALFTWRFLIMVLRWLMKVTENPTFGQWADMLATFDFNYKTGW